MTAAVLACAAPALADADTKSDAEALFKKGKKLAGEKRYADACPAFEQSDTLDPGIGTKLNAARCYEDWGKLAHAHRWYAAAEKMAVAADDERLPKIRELLAAIDPDVPRLTIKVPANADLETAAVQLDGEPLEAGVFGTEMRIDPGPHEITYVVDGAKKSKMLAMERGGEREITLVLPAGSGRGRKGSGDEPARPGRTRKIIALSVGAAGVLGLGAASYLTLDARGTYNDALDAHCMGMANACNAEGLSITADARSQANTATVITLISVAAIAGGVVLYLTAPSGEPARETSALYLAPVVSDRSGGFVVGGGF